MKKKVKVLVITHSFPTKINPLAHVWLLTQLQELRKYCEFKIVFPYLYAPKFKKFNPYYKYSKVPAIEKVEGIPVYHPKYPMIPRTSFVGKHFHWFLFLENILSYYFSKKTAQRVAREWKPDIVHMQGGNTEGLLGILLKKKFNLPAIVTTYGEDVTKYPKLFPMSLLAKHTFQNADSIICQSKFMIREIRKLGIKKKFFATPMGSNPHYFKSRNKEKIRKELKLPKSKKIILFCGHLVERKGVKYLIKAMQNVLEKEKNVKCLVIGGGSQEKYLKALSKKIGVSENIHFLGPKLQEDVSKYMNACDVFVLPSLNEGLPVVLYEALACGSPLVATAVAGTPELVTKEVGFLVKPKDHQELGEKIVISLRKKWDRKKLLKKGSEYSAVTTSKKVLSVYTSLVHSPKRV